MDQKINVLIVEPGKDPRPAAVEDALEVFQQIVGGPIEAGCYLPQRVMLVCNGAGKHMGLPPNRPNPNDGKDTICGPFLLCSFDPCPGRSIHPFPGPLQSGGERNPQ